MRDGVERARQIGHAATFQFFELKGSTAVRAHDDVLKFVKRELRRGRVGLRLGRSGIAVPNIYSRSSDPTISERFQ